MFNIALISCTAKPTSGWGSITHEICTEFEKRNDLDFTLYLPQGETVEDNVVYKKRVRYILPKFVGSFRGRRLLELPAFWWPRLQIDGVDIFHSIIEFPYGVLAGRLASFSEKPFIISGQGTYSVVPFCRQPDWLLARWAFRRAAAITVPSQYTRQRTIEASRLDLPIKVIHNAVNFERFQQSCDAESVRARFGFNNHIILGVGGLKKRKGFDVLIRSLALVKREIPEAQLVIVGEGHARQELTALAQEMRLGADVHLVGEILGAELVAYFQACDVYAHTPRVVKDHFEGFGIVYLEAGACGKPVVGSNSGGVSDAILDGETGFLVSEDDPTSTAEALVRILRDSKLAAAMGRQGREYAARHSWTWYTQEMVRLYRSVTASEK